MQIQYRSVLFSESPGWYPGELVAFDGGYVVTRSDGKVLSVQPNGTFEFRDAGTRGAYEVCNLDATLNILHYSPMGIQFAVPYRHA